MRAMTMMKLSAVTILVAAGACKDEYARSTVSPLVESEQPATADRVNVPKSMEEQAFKRPRKVGPSPKMRRRGGVSGGGLAMPPTGAPPPADMRMKRKSRSASRRILAQDPDDFDSVRVVTEAPASMTFQDYGVNPTIATADNDTSTFAVDVDTASYSVARAHLQKGQLPTEAAVRVEEFINAFDYAYQAPKSEPFLVQAEVFPSPNRTGYHVLHIGIKAREVDEESRKPANLVFVIDVSGSMQGTQRLGLVKRALTMLTGELDGRDSVGIVVYGSEARVVVQPTRASRTGKQIITQAIARLRTEGATNVQAGLELGYRVVAANLGKGRVNRVILCSDGVANTGATEAEQILKRVAREANRGVTISTVGFGMGNYNDVLMEKLADKGNGNYSYVDGPRQARKVFVEQLSGTLEMVAKDVKIQMVFDEKAVSRYRLLGFENRMLDRKDFDNDRVDAGEIGAGHTVTAMYELKFRARHGRKNFGTLKVRYKAPEGSRSRLTEQAIPTSIVRNSYGKSSAPTKLSMVSAAFAEKLRGSYWARNMSYDHILKLWNQIPPGLQARADVQELRSLIISARSLDTRGDRYEKLVPVAMMDFDRVPVLR